MSKVFLYLRKFDHIGTIVYKTDKNNAVELMKKYEDGPYELGIILGRDINMLNETYREFAPYTEITSEQEIIDIITGKQDASELCQEYDYWRNKDNISNEIKLSIDPLYYKKDKNRFCYTDINISRKKELKVSKYSKKKVYIDFKNVYQEQDLLLQA